MMLKPVRRDRMYAFIWESWNPQTGCLYDCYNGRCWARMMCARFSRIWGHGFEPKFHPERLRRRFKPGSVVFVSSLGDLFGDWVPDDSILAVMDVIRANPGTLFFLQTKNPRRYAALRDAIPPNVILSATIETNRDMGFSKAPPQRSRILAMSHPSLSSFRKHVSVEPVMKFDLSDFADAIARIEPEAVTIGYDNYGAGLPEPRMDEVIALARALAERLKFAEVHIKIPRPARSKIFLSPAAHGGAEPWAAST